MGAVPTEGEKCAVIVAFVGEVFYYIVWLKLRPPTCRGAISRTPSFCVADVEVDRMSACFCKAEFVR